MIPEEDDSDVVRTVGELVERLGQFPPETPVLATWEGVFETMAVARELYHGRLLILADEIDRVYYYGEHQTKDGSTDGWY